MPSQEDIANQQELLATYRRRLAGHLKQQAALGESYAPPGVQEGIREARDNIRRIKGILRGWRTAVEDLPDDEPSAATPFVSPASPITSEAPRARIFMSYKRDTDPDELVALEIYRALSQQHDVFIDQSML